MFGGGIVYADTAGVVRGYGVYWMTNTTCSTSEPERNGWLPE
jgi:hypothetical protein